MSVFFEKIIGVAILAGIVFGLFTTGVAPFEMFKKAQAEKWPSRPGVITKSYASQKRGARSASYWRPEICGTYKDDGGKFCVTRVRYGGFIFGDGKGDTFEMVARYPVGREVAVFHSPDDPREIVLEAHSSWTEMITLFGLGLVFLILPVALWLFRAKPGSQRHSGM